MRSHVYGVWGIDMLRKLRACSRSAFMSIQLPQDVACSFIVSHSNNSLQFVAQTNGHVGQGGKDEKSTAFYSVMRSFHWQLRLLSPHPAEFTKQNHHINAKKTPPQQNFQSFFDDCHAPMGDDRPLNKRKVQRFMGGKGAVDLSAAKGRCR